MPLFAKITAISVTLACALHTGALAARSDLSFASWGGAHMQAQQKLLVEPFAERTGIQVGLITHNGSLAPLRDAVAWDGVSLLRAEAEAGCREGVLRPFDSGQLQPAPDGRPASEDFLPGLLLPCAVGETVWSLVLAYAADQWPQSAPASIADLFDPARFPGYRALNQHPRGLLEWALLADGVERQSVYAVLSTEAGLDRAFAQLDRIRPWIRWWQRLEQPMDWLAAGEVSMAAVFSDHYLQRMFADRARFPLLWDGHLWQAAYWAIPATAADVQNARRFVSFSSSTEIQAQRMRFMPFGPTRDSAVRALHLPYRDDLPTWPDNFSRGLEWDLVWWQTQGEAARQKFAQWLEQPADLSASVPGVEALEPGSALPIPKLDPSLPPKPR